MKRTFVFLLVFISLLSAATYAQDLEEVKVFNKQVVLDGRIFENTTLQYPFLKKGNALYMPLDYSTLRALGYLSSWNKETKTFRVYTDTNKTYTVRQSEVKWSDSSVANAPSDAKFKWFENESLNGQLIQANGILYLSLSDDVLSLCHWASSYHELLGLQMNFEGNDEAFADVDQAEILERDALARFMMSKNKKLPYKEAREYVDTLIETSQTHEIGKMWIMAILWQESWYDKQCEYKGAIGLMQIMGSTGRALGLTKEQLFDPHISISYGIKYLKNQVDAFNGNLELGILAYNQGPVRVKKGNYKTGYLNQVKKKKKAVEKWVNEYKLSQQSDKKK